jgi:RNA-binding protein YlmH
MSSVYQHFRPEEKEFVDQVAQWRTMVEEQYSPKLTDFLDPRQQYIVESLIGINSDVQRAFFGGYSEAERKRCLIYPSYWELSESDFHLNVFEVKYPSKFVHLEHKHILGSLMSLGLVREKFGDILIQNDQIQIIVQEELSSFVKLNLTHAGKASIELNEVNLNNIQIEKEQWLETATTISSLRLDVILAAMTNLSRQKTQTIIHSGKVKVNWRVTEDSSFECKEGDILSTRGFGRGKIVTIEGKTKKDKLRIVMGILK